MDDHCFRGRQVGHRIQCLDLGLSNILLTLGVGLGLAHLWHSNGYNRDLVAATRVEITRLTLSLFFKVILGYIYSFFSNFNEHNNKI